MTREEVAKSARDLLRSGYRFITEHDLGEKKARILKGNGIYAMYVVEYTRNERGIFTASAIRVYDMITEIHLGVTTGAYKAI